MFVLHYSRNWHRNIAKIWPTFFMWNNTCLWTVLSEETRFSLQGIVKFWEHLNGRLVHNPLPGKLTRKLPTLEEFLYLLCLSKFHLNIETISSCAVFKQHLSSRFLKNQPKQYPSHEDLILLDWAMSFSIFFYNKKVLLISVTKTSCPISYP